MPITRRQAWKALAAGSAISCTRRTQRPPNFLFILTDDHSTAALGCYGNTLLRTPNLDSIAGEGIRFSNAFVSNSLCAPARAACLTGAFSHVNGVRGNSEGRDTIERLNPEVPLFPDLLQKYGYRTAIVGKWHLQDEPKSFDYSSVLPGQGLYHDPEFIERGIRKKLRGYATDLTTDFALDFLRSVGSQPFCLLCWHKAPHRPFLPAPRHANLFTDTELPYPRTFDDDYATRQVAREAEDMRFDVSLAPDYPDLPRNLNTAQRKRWIYQRFVKDYYRAVVGVDENVGRLLDFLAQNQLADDTMVIYSTDNGFFLGEHGWYDKRFMYEPSLRIPLLIRYPRLQQPARLESRLVQNIDIAPTILDFAGVPVPETVQGRSLRPLLEGREPDGWRQSVYYAYYENSWALRGKTKDAMTDPGFAYFTPHRVGPHRGVRDARFKLIEYYSDDYWELFDLERDPDELRNVFKSPDYASVAARMRSELGRLRALYGDL